MNPTQILFDIAVSGVLAQGDFAREDRAKGCYLRTLSGLACAVGQCIKDEFYDLELEDNPNPVIASANEIRQAIAKSHPELNLDVNNDQTPYWQVLSYLQTNHDHASDLMDFKKNARRIANNFDLVFAGE